MNSLRLSKSADFLQVLSQMIAAIVCEHGYLFSAVAGVRPTMMIPAFADIRQCHLGKHAFPQVQPMVAVLGCSENELCLSHVAGIEVKRSRFRVI